MSLLRGARAFRGCVFPLLFFCLWFFFFPYSSPGTLAQCVLRHLGGRGGVGEWELVV